MSLMRFSIIVPFFNEGNKILSLLESLRSLSPFSPNYEVIFVDNKSTDESPDLVRRFGFQVEPAPLIPSSYYARNVGVSCASGEYLVFVDADCIVSENLLIAYEEYLEKTIDPENVVFAGDIRPARIEGTFLEKYAALRGILGQKSAVTGWAYRPFAQTANAMYSREAFLRVGGFQPRMTSGGDAEICWRFADQLGARFVYAENAVVFHQHRKELQDFIAQFHKYGVGRVQQVLVSEKFSHEKTKDNPRAHLKILNDIFDELRDNGTSESTLMKFVDAVKDIAYHAGRSEELEKNLQAKFGLEGHAYIRRAVGV